MLLNFLKTPHIKGICIKIFILKPKKPNSAFRKVMKIKSIKHTLYTYIPGVKSHILENQEYLIANKNKNDLIGIKTSLVCKNNIFMGLNRFNSRSKYGIKKHKI